jgi:hypothetical protein
MSGSKPAAARCPRKRAGHSKSLSGPAKRTKPHSCNAVEWRSRTSDQRHGYVLRIPKVYTISRYIPKVPQWTRPSVDGCPPAAPGDLDGADGTRSAASLGGDLLRAAGAQQGVKRQRSLAVDQALTGSALYWEWSSRKTRIVFPS